MNRTGQAWVFKNTKYLWIIFALVPLLYFSTLNNFFQEDITLWDGCDYMRLAKSLSEGAGYQINGSPYTVAPFMFPLLLTPIVKFFGYNIFFMRLLEALFAIFTAVAVFILFREVQSTYAGAIVALWTALSPLLLYQATEVLSEIPYLFFSILSLFFFHKTIKEDHLNNKYLWLAALFMAMSYYTRSIGLSFLFALFLFSGLEIWFSHRKALILKKMILLSSGFVILIIPWLLRNQKLTGNPFGTYGIIYGGSGTPVLLINTVRTNLLHYHRFLLQIFTSDFYNALLVVFIIILITTGFLSIFLTRKRTIVEYYFIASILVFLVYPFQGGNKYLLTYLPFFFYYIFLSLQFYTRTVGEVFDIKRRPRLFFPANRTILVIFAILSLTSMVISDMEIIKKERKSNYYSPIMINLQQVCEYIKTNTPKEAIFLVSRIPPYIRLVTEREVRFYSLALEDPLRSADTEKIVSVIEQSRADYVITDGSWISEKSLEPVVGANEILFRKIFGQGTCCLYEVAKPIDRAKLVYLKDGQYAIKIRSIENPSVDKVGPWNEIKPGGKLDAAILVESLHPDQIERIVIAGRSNSGQALQVYPLQKGIWSAAMEPSPGGTIIYFEPYELGSDLVVELHYKIKGIKDSLVYSGTIKQEDVLMTLKKEGRSH